MYLQSNQKEILINFSNIDELCKNKLKFGTIIEQTNRCTYDAVQATFECLIAK